MKAGRELDSLVAEKVMGWKEVRCENGGNIPSGEPDDDWNRDARADSRHGFTGIPCVHREEVPHYSTDIAAAWEIVEKLHLKSDSRGDCITSINVSKELHSYRCEITCDETAYITDAETAPLAICLNALKVIT